jgi:DNA-binding NarL/FixJ family response regulator
LVADDYPLFRLGLARVLSEMDAAVECVEADSAAAARSALAAREFDLILIELDLPDGSGFELLSEVHEQYPAVPVVAMSGTDESTQVIRAIDLGAMGVLPKRSSTELFRHALELVRSGGFYVPPMSEAVKAVSAPPVGDLKPAPVADSSTVDLSSLVGLDITPRQMGVLKLLLEGKPNKQIARELNVSTETIKDHVAAVLRALGVSSRTQAVVAVAQWRRK